jgi:hypothetical protein
MTSPFALAGAGGVTSLTSGDELSAWLLAQPSALHVLFCFAPWHAPSAPGGVMHAAFAALAAARGAGAGGALFASADADAAPEIAEELALEAVPSFYFFRARAAVPGGALQGADAAALTARACCCAWRQRAQRPLRPPPRASLPASPRRRRRAAGGGAGGGRGGRWHARGRAGSALVAAGRAAGVGACAGCARGVLAAPLRPHYALRRYCVRVFSFPASARRRPCFSR